MNISGSPIGGAFQASWPVTLAESFTDVEGQMTQRGQRFFDRFGRDGRFTSTLTQIVVKRGATDEPNASMIRACIRGRSPHSEETSVRTPDGMLLNGVYIPGWHSPQKVIMFCNPNDTPYEAMASVFFKLAYLSGCSGLVFNQRDSGISQGTVSCKGLVMDAYSMFQYLVEEKGIDPNNIIIYGRSMGGGWGAEAAALVQKEYPQAHIKFISERSFSSLTREAGSFTGDVPVLSNIIGRVIEGIFFFCGLEFDSVSAIETLKGRTLVIFHQHDGIINYPKASLISKLDQARCVGRIGSLELTDTDLSHPGDHYHMRDFREEEYEQIVDAIKDMLDIRFNFDPNKGPIFM